MIRSVTLRMASSSSSSPRSSRFLDVRLAAVLAQRILPLTAGSVRAKRSLQYRLLFIISVGMHARHLRKHISHPQSVCWRELRCPNKTPPPAHIIEAALVDIGDCAEMVFQDGLHWQECIPGTPPRPLMVVCNPLATAQHGCQHIAHRQVVIIVRMEVQMRMRITFHHFPHNSMTCNGFSTPMYRAAYTALYWSASMRPSIGNTYSGESFMPLLQSSR